MLKTEKQLLDALRTFQSSIEDVRGEQRKPYLQKLTGIVNKLNLDVLNRTLVLDPNSNVNCPPFDMKDVNTSFFAFKLYCENTNTKFRKSELPQFYQDLAKVYAYCTRGKLSIEKVVNGMPRKRGYYCDFGYTAGYSDLTIQVYKKNGTTVLWDMKKIMRHNFAIPLKYSSYDLVPYEHANFQRCPHNIFNVYVENVANLIKPQVAKYPSFRLKVILYHMKYVLCGGDHKMYRGFKSWYANLIQRPHVKVGRMCVFVSKQGVGKSCHFNWVKNHVFGPAKSYSVDSIEKCVQQFNATRAFKSLIIINELKNTTDIHNASGIFTLMKNEITEEEILANEKFIKAILVKDVAAFIGMSNHFNCIFLEDSDRRYIIFECSSELVNQTEYFKLLFECQTPYTADEFLSYHMYYKALDMQDINQIPISDAKIRLQKAASPLVMQFLNDLTNGEYKAMYRMAKKSEEVDNVNINEIIRQNITGRLFCTVPGYYSLFIDFCKMRKCTRYGNYNTFKAALEEHFKSNGADKPRRKPKAKDVDVDEDQKNTTERSGIHINYYRADGSQGQTWGYYLPKIQNEFTLEKYNDDTYIDDGVPVIDDDDEKSIDEDNIDEKHKGYDQTKNMTRAEIMKMVAVNRTIFEPEFDYQNEMMEKYE